MTKERAAWIAKKKQESKFKKLHWQTLDESKLENSVWATKMDDEDDEDELDLENLKSLFGNSPKNKKKKKKRMSQMSKEEIEAANKNKKNVRLLDSKRAYNVEISLSKFRKFESYEAIGDAIENSDNRLDLDMYILLKKIYPTSTETTVLKGIVGKYNPWKGGAISIGNATRAKVFGKIDCSLFCVNFHN